MSIERLSKYLKEQGNKIALALGDFVLIKQIGQGGNGLVYEAKLLDKIVAVKFLITKATGKTRQQNLARFLAEYFNIITMDNLTNIVRYIDYDLLKIIDDEGEIEIPVIIMKRYDCSLVKQPETNNQKELLTLFHFLLDTTEHIHKSGIIHRDIKPENILVDSNKFILADFGIANYNPDIFQIRAETDNKERLGNRLFSAPEQEDKGVEPHPTMDIYAIGQVLQWYATGKTHRGTGRQRISTIFKELEVQDRIIEKCLENDPVNRFQSIEEIRSYIKRSREKDPFEYLHLFNQICRSNFPKNEFRILHSADINRINRLLNSFKDNEKAFDTTLWWHDGLGNFEFTLLPKDAGIWKFCDTEYKIKEIWIHYDNSEFNDFILVHHIPGEPFIIEGKETYCTAVVDDRHHISYSEYQNGYAEIEGNIVDLSKHKVEFIERKQEDGYFFIGTTYHCILTQRNDETVRNIIEQFQLTSTVDTEKLRKFEREIRRNKDREVMMRL